MGDFDFNDDDECEQITTGFQARRSIYRSRLANNKPVASGYAALTFALLAMVPTYCTVPFGVAAIIAGILGLKSGSHGCAVAGLVIGCVCVLYWIILLAIGQVIIIRM
jgi:hypothetical protein